MLSQNKIEIFNFPQGTEAWFKCRLGIATASCFKDILAKGKGATRRTYMLKLAGERITGNGMDNYSNYNMERGHLQEGVARALYAERSGNDDVQLCGFMRRGPVGYSPDGLIDDDGGLEIKTKFAHLQAHVLLTDEVPEEHVAQIQGGLLVSGRKWMDFVSYCPEMPIFIKRVERDEAYLDALEKEIYKFNSELNDVVEMIKSKF